MMRVPDIVRRSRIPCPEVTSLMEIVQGFDASTFEVSTTALHLWRVALAPRDPAMLRARRSWLTPDEIARSNRFRSQALSDRFVLCRGALRLLLGAYTGRSPAHLTLEYGGFGKPAIASGGGHASLTFNVAHAGEFALIALAVNRSVGVDLEPLRALPDADSLADRVLTPSERARYDSTPQEARPAAFLQYWTAKEAFVKATGEGLSRSLTTFEALPNATGTSRIVHIDGDASAARQWSLHVWQPAPGYIGALAARGRRLTVSSFDLPTSEGLS
jgi:4'-phosphopantetheinyl transferase